MTPPSFEGQDTITIGVLYPEAWDTRPRAELDADMAALHAIDPRIRVLDVRYEEDHDLRTARGKPPYDGLREQAPALSEQQRAMFAEVDIVLTLDLPFDVATLAPRLKLVHGVGAGVGQLVSSGLADGGIRLANATGVSAVSIAEFAVARFLAAWKRFDELAELQARHEWGTEMFGRELAGATATVLGLGAIGSNIARRLQAFDVTVLATRRSYRPGMGAAHVDELHGPDALLDLLGRSDAVFAAVPETAETIATMDATAFAAMKPGSFFCNVGRGSFVVEDALVDALRSGHLGAAAIDVASVEPLPADSPLWDAPRLAISPHASASVDRYFSNLHLLFRENVRAFVAGEPLRTEVDPARGY